jgi:hypothetical protein
MFYGQHIGFGAGGGPVPTFLTIITDASLTTDLELCLDAGDGNSYTSGQDWVDVSGSSNADEFFRGSGTGSDSADPTFNGTVDGRSENEYFSFDGGDEFEYGAANETWMKNMHKNNADFSMLCAFYVVDPGSGSTGLFGTGPGLGGVATGVGLSIHHGGADGGDLHFRAAPHNGGSPGEWVNYNGNTNSSTGGNYTDTGVNDAAWNIIGFSLDEASGSAFHYLNGAYNQVLSANTFDGTYFTDSGIVSRQTGGAGGPLDSTGIMHIGSWGSLDPATQNGCRMGVIAFWSTSLSKANFDTIWDTLRVRYGI